MDFITCLYVLVHCAVSNGLGDVGNALCEVHGLVSSRTRALMKDWNTRILK